MKIGIANDHTGTAMKKDIITFLAEKGHEVIDYGTGETTASDYPEYGAKIGHAVAAGEVEAGVAICGTGIGISLAANRVRGIRAAVCSEPVSARLAKQHNNANIIAFGARIVGTEMAKAIVAAWLEADFLGDRHSRRVAMLDEIK